MKIHPFFQSIIGAFLLTRNTCQGASGFNFDLKVPARQQQQQQQYAPAYYAPYPMMAPYGYQPQYFPQYQMAPPMFDPQNPNGRPQAAADSHLRAKDQGAPMHMAQTQGYGYGPMPQYSPFYAQPQPPKDETTKLGFGMNFDDPNKFDVAGLLQNIMGGATGMVNAAGMKKKMEVFEKLLTMNALPNIR